MAIIRPADWTTTSASTLSEGDRIYYNGTVYERTSVAANTRIPVDNDAWDLHSVIRIEDFYSLQESIRLAMNTSDQQIIDSIPLFIQRAEQDINKILRSPAQIVTRPFTVIAGSRFQIPEDTLNVINIRTTAEDAGYDLRSQGAIQFLNGNKTEFERVRQYYTSNGGSFEIINFQYPVYYFDGTHFHLAPDIDTGTTGEITYYQAVASLGETVNLVNDDFEPINSTNQTEAQWVAAGNAASDFVQATQVNLSNLWTATIPHLLRLGALIAAEEYVKDDTRIEVWKAEYDDNMQKTIDEFERFKTDQASSLQMESAYSRL